MQKYDKFLKNISELIEKSLFVSKDLKKDASKVLKYRIEDITNKLRSKAQSEGIDMLELKRARKSVINYLEVME